MEEQDILKEIPDEELPNLKDLFKKYWPDALHAFYLLDNYIDWKKKSASKMKFYCPEGRWDDGTFIGIETYPEHSVFAFTLEGGNDRLRNALMTTKRICWSNPNCKLFFLTVHERIHSMIADVIKEKKMTITQEDIANMWWITKEDALKYEYEIPQDMYLAPLKEEDVKVIDPIWPHYREGVSKLYLEELIQLNGGFGLYNKENNSLCSWIMRNNYGGLAILQTLDEHKRKGYGSIMIKVFSKFWAEKGLDIFCFIMIENTGSQILFEKHNFKKEHEITWIRAT